MKATSKLMSKALAGALLVLGTAANAQSVSFDFNFIAQANTAANLTPGGYIPALGGTNLGSISFTDLSDLNLQSGDVDFGKTGIRVSATLNNLSQFGAYGSNTLELNLLGTGSGAGGTEWVTSADSFNSISNNFTLNGGAESGIEWDEHGSVGNGTTSTATSHKWAFFQQQFNVVLGTWTDGQTITFDLLNGGTLSGGPNTGQQYNGFTVANVLANPVANQDGLQPSSFAWLRLQPTAGVSGIPANTGQWFYPYMLSTNGRINIQATAVPEANSSAMLATGLAMLGFMAARRRRDA